MARNYERISVWFECTVYFRQGKPKIYTLANYEALHDLEEKCKKNPAVGTVISSRVEKSIYVKKY